MNYSNQMFTASAAALDRQLEALDGAHRAPADWIVTLDLDDVVIDDARFLYDMAVKCRQPQPADWKEWLLSGRSGLMPGAARFIRDLRAQAADGHGRIVLFTSRPKKLREATVAELKRLNVMTGADDAIVTLVFAATPQTRDAAWRKLTAKGARLALVVGGHADQFPDDPALPVGVTARSCPVAAAPRVRNARASAWQSARFGRCYFLLPVHVL